MQFKDNITAQDFFLNDPKLLHFISEDICRGKLHVDTSRSERRRPMWRTEGEAQRLEVNANDGPASPAPSGSRQSRFAES